LIKEAGDQIGDARGTPSTLLVKAFDDADYTFDAAGGTTKETTALTAYELWQKILMQSLAINASCWAKAGTDAGNKVDIGGV